MPTECNKPLEEAPTDVKINRYVSSISTEFIYILFLRHSATRQLTTNGSIAERSDNRRLPNTPSNVPVGDCSRTILQRTLYANNTHRNTRANHHSTSISLFISLNTVAKRPIIRIRANIIAAAQIPTK